MRIRAGFEISFECAAPTPMMLLLSVHPSRLPDLVTPHEIVFDPPISAVHDRDIYDNICTRIVAPAGRTTFSADFIVADPGTPEQWVLDAREHPLQELPTEALTFLMASRYCETDRLSALAWSLFGNTPPGWSRVQAICDFVHDRLTFGYHHARPTRTAWDGYNESLGVCRDFAHLAVTLCRCMNIPARYCTGYLGDIGVPASDAPMDFSAWFEAYLGGHWHTFDARHNQPRIGRILMARGRDAADVAISTTFGNAILTGFKVITDELPPPSLGVASNTSADQADHWPRRSFG
jgi:transglutaminase-like putative cysteine protease